MFERNDNEDIKFPLWTKILNVILFLVMIILILVKGSL